MTTFDQLIQHRRDFPPCQFAELSEHPCSKAEDALLLLLAAAPVLIVGLLCAAVMSRVSDFIQVFRLYRRFGNSAKHSAKAAWHVAVQRLPF